jgi:hypothetical protein
MSKKPSNEPEPFGFAARRNHPPPPPPPDWQPPAQFGFAGRQHFHGAWQAPNIEQPNFGLAQNLPRPGRPEPMKIPTGSIFKNYKLPPERNPFHGPLPGAPGYERWNRLQQAERNAKEAERKAKEAEKNAKEARREAKESERNAKEARKESERNAKEARKEYKRNASAGESSSQRGYPEHQKGNRRHKYDTFASPPGSGIPYPGANSGNRRHDPREGAPRHKQRTHQSEIPQSRDRNRRPVNCLPVPEIAPADPTKCPSQGKQPTKPVDDGDYKRQTRIFHPDRNKGCPENANSKFQCLNNMNDDRVDGVQGGKSRKSKRKPRNNKSRKNKK